LTDTLIWRKI